MTLTKKPVTGMRDTTPAGMQIRECMMNQIKETYKSFGFTQIETSRIEHTGNLTSKQGRDNGKLIFKILRRGDKLNLGEAKEEDDLADSGLHYNLTLPLSCYYANDAASLPSSFKTFQMGSVQRADRPQKGRSRQFAQCDIDILGDATSLAEIKPILAAATALERICSDNSSTARINDRGTLRDMALYYGFPEEPIDQVFITLDKVDKIGYEGVEKEFLESGYCSGSVSKCLNMPKSVTEDPAGVKALGQMLSEVMPTNVSGDLAHIMDTVAEVAEADLGLESDPTLVKGMSYYTGTISEVSTKGFDDSVAGGGRYDKIIGKFTDMETPACGFPIGFEYIITILVDDDFTVPGVSASKVLLFEKGMDSAKLATVVCEAMEERKKGVRVLVVQMNKNEKFQREQLGREEYTEFKRFYKESLKN